jgi:hypothetical protein
MNRYYALLEELYNCYDISAGTEIATFILEKLKNNPADVVDSKHIKSMLLGLEKDGLATWNAMPMANRGNPFEPKESEMYKGLLGTNDNPNFQNFRQIYVEVQLTSKGLNYVENIIDRRLTRESQLFTNKWIVRLTGILALAALLTLIIEASKLCQHRSRSSKCQEKRQCCKINSNYDTLSGQNNKPSLNILQHDSTKK